MDPGRRCLVSEWSPFSEGSLLGGHVSDQQLLGSLAAWWDGREVSAMSSCVHVCPWVDWRTGSGYIFPCVPGV